MFRYSKKSMFDRVENGRPKGPIIGGLMSKWALENLNSLSLNPKEIIGKMHFGVGVRCLRKNLLDVKMSLTSIVSESDNVSLCTCFDLDYSF